jgi:glycine/D-amino acid oxidase-like deaminating enzyme
MEPTWDVVIAGGGIMGVSAAFWLTKLGAGRVCVVEPDPSLARSSTALSVASIRQQFSNPVNVRISAFGIGFLRNIREHVDIEGFPSSVHVQENGYLFLAGSAGAAERMRAVAAMQVAEGAATRLLSPEEISARFPYLATGDLILGSWGPKDEGWFDNMGLHDLLRRAAKAQGAEFVTDRVVGIERVGDRIGGATLASGARLSCGTLVNASGTAAAQLLRMIGEDLPVEPRKRTVFVVDAPKARHADAPLLIDHQGYYARPEGRTWLTATVPQDDGPADPQDFEPDWNLFEDVIWEKIWRRMPDFDEARVVRAWAGHYAFNTLDQNAIVGRWPTCPNLVLMNGFSGHGLQQAPAMGRAVAELIVQGGFRTLDLSDLGPERILAGRPFLELAVV